MNNVIPFPHRGSAPVSRVAYVRPRRFQAGDVVRAGNSTVVITEFGENVCAIRGTGPDGSTYNSFASTSRLRELEALYDRVERVMDGRPCDTQEPEDAA